MPPVPQTDTGGQVEKTEAIERILVKELGKLLPFLRFKGDPLPWRPWRPERRGVAQARG